MDGVATIYLGDYYEYEVGIGITRSYYGSGSAMRVAGASDPESNGVYYLLKDHLGGTNMTIDSAGNVVGEMRYKAWGETRYTSGTTPTDLNYTGQRQEPDLGFYYYRARWYDPTLGRFMQADTIVPEAGNPMALDRYAYVANSPTRLLDPSGHCWGIFSFMRDLPSYDVTCNNLDMAWLIVNHDNANLGEKIIAGGYAAIEGVAHGAVAVGSTGVACGLSGACAALVEPALGIGTAACADGDCTNEARAVSDLVNAACADGDCNNEISGIKQIIPELGNKLDFLLGKATGSIENIQRSLSMQRSLLRIGLYDNDITRELLSEHFIEVINNPDNIVMVQESGRVVRESFLMGPYGGLIIRSIWEDTKLITMWLLK